MEDADWNSYRQKLCCLMHRTDICGRTLSCQQFGACSCLRIHCCRCRRIGESAQGCTAPAQHQRTGARAPERSDHGLNHCTLLSVRLPGRMAFQPGPPSALYIYHRAVHSGDVGHRPHSGSPNRGSTRLNKTTASSICRENKFNKLRQTESRKVRCLCVFPALCLLFATNI